MSARRVEPRMQISKPYPHGAQFRCRVKTDGRWRWGPTVPTPEEAVRAAGGNPDEAPCPAAEPEPQPEPQPQRPAADPIRPIRIEGPYPKGNRFRCRIVVHTGRVWCPTAPTRAKAYKLAETMATGAARQGLHSVRQAVDSFLAHQTDKGNRETSVATMGHVLRRFFEPVMDAELAKLTPQKGQDLYDRLRKQKTRRGTLIAADTHRNYLLNARSFCTYCVERSWLLRNPLAAVKGVGARSHGKDQLRIDERRKLWAQCIQEGAAGDDGAVGVMLAMWGLRAGEVVTRTVRDLDDGGRKLIIAPNATLGWKPKSRASNRTVPLPAEIQRLLVARTKDKLPASFLFQAEGGGPHWRDWVNENVHRLCKLAGIPEVCAHSLRGSYATTAVEIGVTPEQVAAHLGHESATMTKVAYIAPGALDAAQQQRALRAAEDEQAASPPLPLPPAAKAR